MRCAWAEDADATMRDYHDTEWGVPHHDDRALFELITLEGAQAGLSWRTVLARREAYRKAFHKFNIARVARMTDTELNAVLTGSAVIRHRLKIWSVRDNAAAALAIIKEHGSLDSWLWAFVDGQPKVNNWRRPNQVPATTEISDRMSKAMRKQGFRFVGSTICYAFMQATGMVDDHLVTCSFKGSQ
jgi:DNA-3-methyladenine glycosylase I